MANQYYVSNTDEFNAIVGKVSDGDTIILRENSADDPYDIVILNSDFGATGITITSENPDSKSVIGNIVVRDSAGVHFDGIEVNSDAMQDERAEWKPDVRIEFSKDVSITNSYLHGDATEALTDLDTQSPAETMANVKYVDGFVFENNLVEHYFHGLSVSESDNISISDNEITELQGDGIRMGSVQNVVIDSNYIHDFFGAAADINHTDFIQLWAIRPEQVSENITISNNILDSGSGAAAQGIFLRNEAADGFLAGDDVDTADLYFSDITIENNFVYTNSVHGITVGKANGVEVNNNTVIYNPQTSVEHTLYPPSINIDATNSDVSVTNNIATTVSAPEGSNLSNNYDVNYTNEKADNYADKVLVNLGAGGKTSYDQLAIDPDGPLGGVDIGADLSTIDASTDAVVARFEVSSVAGSETTFVFDAGLSSGPDGYLGDGDATYKWVFEDGTVKTGKVIEHDFGEAGIQKVELTVETENGVSDSSVGSVEAKSPLLVSVAVNDGKLVDFGDYFSSGYTYDANSVTDDGINISDGEELVVFSRSKNLQIFDHEEMTISIGLQRNETDGGGGDFLNLYTSYQASVQDDGTVKFTVFTDDGGRTDLVSDVAITDTDWHHFTVSMDSTNNTVTMYIDGAEVASGEMSGKVKPLQSWNLMLGYLDTANANVDSLTMLSVAADADAAKVASSLFLADKNDGDGEVSQEKIANALLTSEGVVDDGVSDDGGSKTDDGDPGAAPTDDPGSDSDDDDVSSDDDDQVSVDPVDYQTKLEQMIAAGFDNTLEGNETNIGTYNSVNNLWGTDESDLFVHNSIVDFYRGGEGFDVIQFNEAGEINNGIRKQSIEGFSLVNGKENQIEVNDTFYSKGWESGFFVFGESIDTADISGHAYYKGVTQINGNDFHVVSYQNPYDSAREVYVDATMNVTFNGSALHEIEQHAADKLEERGIDASDLLRGSVAREKLAGTNEADTFLYDEDDTYWGGAGIDTIYFDQAGDIRPTSGHWSVERFDMENGVANTMDMWTFRLVDNNDGDAMVRGDDLDTLVIHEELHYLATETVDGRDFFRVAVSQESGQQVLIDSNLTIENNHLLQGFDDINLF